MANTVSFTVPLVPPSVNHYKMRTREGVTFVSAEAKAFKTAVAVFGRGLSLCDGLEPKQAKKLRYQLDVTVFLGKGQRGDGDNFFKCIGDGLKEASVIHSDAAIKVWGIQVKRDWGNPRTEITVRAL